MESDVSIPLVRLQPIGITGRSRTPPFDFIHQLFEIASDKLFNENSSDTFRALRTKKAPEPADQAWGLAGCKRKWPLRSARIFAKHTRRLNKQKMSLRFAV